MAPHLRPLLNRKILTVAHYSSGFAQSARPNLEHPWTPNCPTYFLPAPNRSLPDIYVSGTHCDVRTRSQWLGRAGFPPASLFYCKNALKLTFLNNDVKNNCFFPSRSLASNIPDDCLTHPQIARSIYPIRTGLQQRIKQNPQISSSIFAWDVPKV